MSVWVISSINQLTIQSTMFNTDIVLAGDASSSQTYSLTSIANGKSIRQDKALGAALPRTMTISHSVTGKGLDTVDRHLVRFDLAKADAVTGQEVNMSVYSVLEMPRRVATPAQLKDMVTQLKNFLTSGSIDQLLNGEP